MEGSRAYQRWKVKSVWGHKQDSGPLSQSLFKTGSAFRSVRLCPRQKVDCGLSLKVFSNLRPAAAKETEESTVCVSFSFSSSFLKEKRRKMLSVSPCLFCVESFYHLLLVEINCVIFNSTYNQSGTEHYWHAMPSSVSFTNKCFFWN